jgi:regulatory protein YycH of two-component signal transduction system YycFG
MNNENGNWKYVVGGSLIVASAFLGYYLWKRNQIKETENKTETTETKKEIPSEEELKQKQIIELYDKEC